MQFGKGLALGLVCASAGMTSAALAAPTLSWNGANAIVDNVAFQTTLYETTVPDGNTYGRLVWDPAEALSPGISVDNVTVPNSPPGANGCILAGGAACDDPRQSGKRFKLQVTGNGPIDLLFDYADDQSPTGPVDGLYRVFGKVTNVTNRSLTGFSWQLGTGVGDSFSLLDASAGVTFYEPQNSPPRDFELASVFPAGLFSPAGVPEMTSPEGFFSADRSGFNVQYGATEITSAGLFGDYAGLFGDGMIPLSNVPLGYFFDDDMDPLTDDLLMAYLDDATMSWLMGQADGFAPVDQATLDAWAIDPLFSIAPIEDLANFNMNMSIQLAGAMPGQFTLRLTPQVPVPGVLALLVPAAIAGVYVRRRR